MPISKGFHTINKPSYFAFFPDFVEWFRIRAKRKKITFWHKATLDLINFKVLIC